jgi:ParB-like chromosome segregation protein Spo0J
LGPAGVIEVRRQLCPCNQHRRCCGEQRCRSPYVPLDRLKPDPASARQHSAKQIRQIASSIESFEFNVPLLIDRDLNVIAGHGRLLACKRLGWSEVPTIRLEHLSESQRRAFMLADNRLTEIASWDDRLLAEQLQALSSVELDFDIETIGFDMGEIDLRIESLNPKGDERRGAADLRRFWTSRHPCRRSLAPRTA